MILRYLRAFFRSLSGWVTSWMSWKLPHRCKRDTKIIKFNENPEGCFFLLILPSEMWVYAKKSTHHSSVWNISDFKFKPKNSKTLTWKQQNDRLLKFNTTPSKATFSKVIFQPSSFRLRAATFLRSVNHDDMIQPTGRVFINATWNFIPKFRMNCSQLESYMIKKTI